MLMGFGNGIGSGIVMTLAPTRHRGRATDVPWRLARALRCGSGLGPVALSLTAGIAGLGAGILVSGGIGFAAAAALWSWIPRRTPRKRGGARGSADLPGTLAQLQSAMSTSHH